MSPRREAHTPLGQMLTEKGLTKPRERAVHLWKMFHELFLRMREVAEEIERNGE